MINIKKKFVLILCLTVLFGCSETKTYDILIKNAQILDGSGKPSYTGDIGLNADTIAAMGNLKNAKGLQVIDATGLAVAPGFINMLSWANESLIVDGKSQSDIRQGVTLEVFGEGWARNSEQLAEEMGLYETKFAQIRRRAYMPRGFVYDPGLHTKNWTKEQVINYIMESGMSADMALTLYQRSIVWPAQLTSYDAGGEEIKALRILAEEKLGDNFNVKEFHSKILENGAIPLSALRLTIEDWIAESGK